MNRTLKIALALGILSASRQTYARPAATPALRLIIHLYDLANISPQTLVEAARGSGPGPRHCGRRDRLAARPRRLAGSSRE